MHRNATIIISFPFVFILVASLGVGIPQQQSVAGSNDNQTQSELEPDTSSSSNAQSQSSTDDGSETQPESSNDAETNQSDGVADELSNLSSNTLGPDAITTVPSDLVPGNQTSNQTEEISKPDSTITHQLSKGLLQDLKIFTPPTPAPPTKVKVTFNAMTVHDSHEGVFSGEGEYDLSAYVGTHRVDLTTASGPGAGLWDVDKGERVFFDPGTEVELELSPGGSFSIFTVGSEVDGCGKTNFPKTVAFLEVVVETIAWEQIEGIQEELNDLINAATCIANANDVLGKINVIHEPPDYGAFTPVGSTGDRKGCDALRSDRGDFTLEYCVTVLATPAPVERTETSDTNKFLSQLNNDLSVIQPETVK